MVLSLPDAVKFWAEEKGCKFAYDSYYVSNLEDGSLTENMGKFPYLGDTAFTQFVVFPEEVPDSHIHITQHFDKQFKLRADTKSRTLKGKYLRIIFAYPEEHQIEYIQQYITHSVNLLKLKEGHGSALECAKQIYWDLISGSHSIKGNNVIPRVHGNGRDENKFYEHSKKSGIKSLEDFSLKLDASALLNEAMESPNKHHCFLFLWMALECQIGQGEERSNFCKNDLHSDIINKEMLRLHKIRSNYAHGLGNIEKDQFNIDILIELLRLSTLKDVIQRKKLVKIVEGLINERN